MNRSQVLVRGLLGVPHLLPALIGACAGASCGAQDLGIEVGSTAPGAKVHTLDGKEADLAQYIGKTAVVMEFWATWCPNCKELEPTLLAASKKYGGRSSSSASRCR